MASSENQNGDSEAVDYYVILDVDVDASQEQIRKQFHKLSLEVLCDYCSYLMWKKSLFLVG